MIDLSLYFISILSFVVLYIMIESVNYVFDFKSFGNGLVFKRYWKGLLLLISNQFELIQNRERNCTNLLQSLMYLVIVLLSLFSIFFIFSDFKDIYTNFWLFSFYFLIYFAAYNIFFANQDELKINENELLKQTIVYLKLLVIFISVNIFKFQNLYFEVLCNILFSIYGLRILFECTDKKYLYTGEKFDRHVNTVWIIGTTSALFYSLFGIIASEIFSFGKVFMFIMVVFLVIVVRNTKRHSLQVSSKEYNSKNLQGDILQIIGLLIIKGGLCKILN